VGTAIYPLDGEDAEILLAEADRRMYALKQQGNSLLASSRGEPVAEPSTS
jgi:GGDEF domain-containing protein